MWGHCTHITVKLTKRITILFSFLYLFSKSLITGLFGEFVYMSIMTTMLLIAGKSTKIWKKIILIASGFLLIIVIQITKTQYRNIIWNQKNTDVNKVELYTNLFSENLLELNLYANKELILPMVVRFNQGMIIGWVMDYIPRVKDFDNGSS